MSFRNRPTIDRRHRPRWQDELRSQQLIVAGFAVAIAIAIGIFGAASWSAFYDNHLREVAYVGSQSFDKDALAMREGILSAELNAKGADLSQSTGGAHDSVVQQQLQVVQETLQNVESNAVDSLTTGAWMRSKAPAYGISVSSDAVDKEIAKRSTLPLQIQMSAITVNALPANAAADATPTDAQWAAALKTANDLLAQLKKGADFATLAKQKSADDSTKDSGGELGWIQGGDASYAAFFTAAKNAKAGDLVGPVKGDVGYAIIKVQKVRAAGPDTLFKALLTAAHASDADYRAYIGDELLKSAFQAYFGDKVLSSYMPQQHVAQIQITPDNGPPIPKERVRHVLIQPIPGADDQSKAIPAQWKAALDKANKVHALLVKPNADWNAIAKTYSDDPGSRDYGGDLGWYDPTTAQVVPEFKTAIEHLALDKISDPVKTQYGYHIIEIFERRISAQEQADNVVAELKKDPGSFAAVAARESADHQSAAKGGDIGWVAPYEKDPALEKAIFALKKVGDLSPPTSASGGIYIFKLLETSTSRWVDPDRLASIKSSGYSNWRASVKQEVGVWIDPQYQSTSSATG